MSAELRGLLAAALLAFAAPPARAQETGPAPTATRMEAERLLFLVQYIRSDYAAAVADGAIRDAFEYAEMRTFSDALLEGAPTLRRHGASPEALALLRELHAAIRGLRPVPEVADLAGRLAARLIGETDLVAWPAAPPDLARGARLFREGCAPCHGAAGAGDGRAVPFLAPAPISLRGAAADQLSPHQVSMAIRHGIEGTAMPSFDWALDREEAWDVAFHVMTLREIDDPRPDDPGLGLTLHDLARSSNAELLERARRLRPDVSARDIAYYRRHLPAVLSAHAGSPPAAGLAPPPGAAADLAVALQLQGALAGVAERLFPSVVGVSSFVRDESAAPGAPAPAATGAWVAPGDEAAYPGFRRWRSASGFIVSETGHALTASDVLLGPDGRPVPVVDLELHGGERVLARVVGVEPTIRLGVVQRVELSGSAAPAMPPARLGVSDRLRVGHLAIALGRLWGPGTIFAAGVLSSQAERQCYQDRFSATLLRASMSLPAEARGGPLANIQGEVVGLNLAADLAPEGGATALPIDLVRTIYEALALAESSESPWLGVSVLEIAAARRARPGAVAPADLARTGVYIDNVFAPSPAARAGVRVGDCLVSIDGQRLFSVSDFQKWVYLSGVGREVALEIFRAGATIELRTTIERRPANAVPR